MAIILDTSIGPVELKECWESYQKGVARDKGPWIKKVFRLEDWSKSDAVVNAFMGSASASIIDGPISRISPHTCVESPNLVAINATCEGIGEVDIRDGGRPTWRLATVTVDYGIPTHETDVGGDINTVNNQFPNDETPGQPVPYITQSIDGGYESYMLPGTSYKYATPTSSGIYLRLQQPVAATIAVANIVISRESVPYLPWPMIKSKYNRLNDTTFLGEPRGTIKFQTAHTRLTILSDGTRAQNLVLNFKWREYDWNKQHRPDESSFDFIQDDNGTKPYVYSNLRPLVYG